MGSPDPKQLFHFIKEQLLSFVDFDNIVIISKVIHFSFLKSELKDELYYGYLCKAMRAYGDDQNDDKEELLMQKQRIGGIIEQIIQLKIFIDKGKLLLESINLKERRK